MGESGGEEGALYRAFQALSGTGNCPGEAELERLLPGDPAARQRLRAMLAAEAETAAEGLERRLDEAIAGRVGDALEALALGEALAAGARFGPWQVEQEIGRGGMARVYRVQRRIDDLLQHGALKLVAHEAADASRFARERRLLAALDHPCIARLLDAGGDARHSWLVMELVDGEPLDQFVAREDPPVRRRVQLLADIADALAHAHRRLVVHRDLKPSNVLVDGEGRVRLIDFGIGRQLDQDDAATATGDSLLTLRYAAPEQLRGEPPAVSVDVYAFGVLAHELLFGRHPFADAPRFGLGERLAGRSPTAVAPDRAPGVHVRVPTDLAAIVACCLRAEPGARYAGADAVRAELLRWLDGRPVQALAGQRGYLVRRFVTRHWPAFGAAALLLAALVGAALVSLEQARRAELARARSAEVAGFLGGLLGDLDPTGDGQVSRDLRLDQVLELGHHRLQRTDLEAGQRAQLLLQLAAGFAGIGRADRAAELGAEARATLDASVAPEQALSVRAEASLFEAQALHHSDPLQAGRRYRALLEQLEGAGPAHSGLRARTLLGQAQLLIDSGQVEGTTGLLERAMELARDDPSMLRGRLLALMAARIDVLSQTDADAALESSERYLEQLREHYGERHEAYAVALANHAVRVEHSGDAEASGRLQQRAWELLSEAVGPDHPNVEAVAINYAVWLMREGRLEQALLMQQHLIDARTRRFGPDSPAVAGAWQNRATTLRLLERWREAEVHARTAQSIYDRVMPADSYLPAVPRITRSQVALALGDASQARQLAREAGERLHSTLGAAAMPTQVAELLRGEAELALGECGSGRQRVASAHQALLAIEHADAARYVDEAARALARECRPR